MEASARGYATARQEEVAPGGQPIELKLGRTGSVKGRVVCGDPPRPLVNFSIEANPKESGGGPMGGFRFMRGAGGGGRNQSDPRGQFTVADLSPGSYTIVCHAEGMQDLVRDGVEVRGGEATELGDLALEAGGTIRGRVISKPEGLPVAGAAVRIKASGLFDMRNMFAGRAEAVLTDMGGRFELRGLPSGQVTIVVEPVNYAKAELAGVTVEAGRETDELTVNVGKGGGSRGASSRTGGRSPTPW